MTMGMALGGLGGFNAHDAGVLKALHDRSLHPDVITCTSGAILWVHQYLTAPERIPEEVRRQTDAVRGGNALLAAVTGIPGVFAPAYLQYWRRWLRPWSEVSINALLDRLLPAQLYVPTRPASQYQAVATTFNEAPVPIMFNAFAIGRGHELVFTNPAGADFLEVTLDDGREHHWPWRDTSTSYRSIDAKAVEAALWLVLYGFAETYRGETVIDGAYHRQLIVTELASCDVIYAVKPQSDAWAGRPPKSYFDVQDFDTEMWFNSSYAAEVAGLQHATEPPQVIPITMKRPLGYFNYFIERESNYTRAYEQASRVFTQAHPDAPEPLRSQPTTDGPGR